MRKLFLLGAPLALMACDDGAQGDVAAPDGPDGSPGLSGTNPPVPIAPADLAALRSEQCADVAQFYFENWTGGETGRAALVWDDPVVDSARLDALLADYAEPQVAWEEPDLDTGNGMPRCEVTGTLADAADETVDPAQGSVTFRRVLEPETSEGQATRWQIESQTFVEPLERSGGDAGEGSDG